MYENGSTEYELENIAIQEQHYLSGFKLGIYWLQSNRQFPTKKTSLKKAQAKSFPITTCQNISCVKA